MIFKAGDTLVLKKKHPCGSFKWKVVKNGIDVTLECVECSRIIKVNRMELRKRIKEIIEIGDVNA